MFTPDNQRGFTVLEITIAVGILALLIVGIVDLLLWGMRGKNVVWEQLSTQNEGRKIVQDFTNELRRATASSIGAYALETAQDQQIVFYTNLDEDSWRERVRYFLSGTVLKKGVIKPSGTPLTYSPADETIIEIVHDVANSSTPLFYYYDQNYTGDEEALASPINVTDVRVVGIELKLEENPQLTPAPFIIGAKAEIRNLKNN